ncbi:MAG: AAA family ATPase [Candidatus Diapherotrites archaeon]|nr:AAA family ATPase [Candidatus Diapherotrites archaeon]
MERVKTGISGLDQLIQGGIPKGSNVLISGGTGTGKTIFTTQYLYNGASQYNEAGLFVTLEGSVRDISWNMESFQWDIKKLQDEGLFNIYRLNLGYIKNKDLTENRIDEQLREIEKRVEEIKAKRLVVDSTTVFGAYIDASILRTTLFQFCDRLKAFGCTTLLTAETKPKKSVFSAYGVEEFVADGVIALYFTPPNRSIFIRKMRGSDHSKNIHPANITAEGFVINAKDNVLWDAVQ